MKNDDSHKSPRKNFAIRDASDPSPASSDVEAPELQAIGDQLLCEARELSSRYPATTVASAHKSHDPDSGHSVSWQQLWRVAACLFIVAGSAAAWISWQNSMNRGAPKTLRPPDVLFASETLHRSQTMTASQCQEGRIRKLGAHCNALPTHRSILRPRPSSGIRLPVVGARSFLRATSSLPAAISAPASAPATRRVASAALMLRPEMMATSSSPGRRLLL